MSEKVSTAFTEANSTFPSEDEQERRLRQMEFSGQGEMAQYHRDSKELQENGAPDSIDQSWKNADGSPVEVMYRPPEVETSLESPKRRGLMKRFGSRITEKFFSKPTEDTKEPFKRDKNGW